MLCAIIVGAAILQYSRLTTIVIPTVATLGASIALVGLLANLFCARGQSAVMIAIVQMITLSLFIFALVWFSLVVDTPYDLRTIGVFSGLFLIPIFYSMLTYGGPYKLKNLTLIFCVIYCVIYIVLTIALSLYGSLGRAEVTNIILKDPQRGVRLFSNTSCISYVIFYSLDKIINGVGRKNNLFIFALGATTIILSQSRMATLSAILIGCVVMLRQKRFLGVAAPILPMALLLVSAVAVLFIDEIGHLLLLMDNASFGIRSGSLSLARYIFEHWPLTGIGYPLDPTSYDRLFAEPFFPEDLGGVGIISNFGLIGLMWICALLFLMTLGIRAAFDTPGAAPLGYVGLYVIIYGFTWPTYLYGDGTIFCSLLIALWLWRRDVDAKPNSTRGAMRTAAPMRGRSGGLRRRL